MNRRLLRAAALALPCLGAFFTPGAQAQVRKPVGFTAVIRFSETVNFTGAAPCFAIGVLDGSGQASTLGPVTATSRDCINPLGAFDPNAPNAFQFVSGLGPQGLVMTLASGEQLFATYAGTLVPSTDGPHVVSGFFVIAGGTGRFRAAGGGGTLRGSEDISRGVFGTGEITLSGRLSY